MPTTEGPIETNRQSHTSGSHRPFRFLDEFKHGMELASNAPGWLSIFIGTPGHRQDSHVGSGPRPRLRTRVMRRLCRPRYVQYACLDRHGHC